LGETVVVDASFTTGASREPFRAAATAAHADVVELRCAAPPQVVMQRVAWRALHPDRYSDADLEIARHLAADAEPWPQAYELDTSGEVAATIANAASICSAVDH
jgi:predicted kinase